MLKKFVLLLSLFLVACGYSGPRVEIDGRVFEVDIADDTEERQQGLMFVEEMKDNKGMIFVYDKPRNLAFWMKNTLIPLDIIYIGENYRVVSIAKNAQPCENDPCKSYSSNVEAQYVLEINGGLSDEYGIEVGDKVDFLW